MAVELDGLDVVVTGGTGALGRAVIEQLLAEGATCHVPVRSMEQAAGHPRPATAPIERKGLLPR